MVAAGLPDLRCCSCRRVMEARNASLCLDCGQFVCDSCRVRFSRFWWLCAECVNGHVSHSFGVADTRHV